MTAQLRLVTPSNLNRTVPTRRPNAELRTREYLTPGEIAKLLKAAKDVRHGQRDATLILVAYRHGLRAIEVADLEWSQVEWDRQPTLHVRRAKNGKRDELRMLHELQRNTTGAFVFETERGGPFTADAINRLIKRIGEQAGIPFPVHAHMLRHACGYAMANAGHDQHTARYTELRADPESC
jgi:integrase